MRSTGEATNQDMLAPDCPPSITVFAGKVVLNVALGLGAFCYSCQTAFGDLHAVGMSISDPNKSRW